MRRILCLLMLLLLLAAPAHAATFIAATTSAATRTLTVSKTSLGTSLQVIGELGSDVITIQITDGASGWQTFVLDSTNQTLTADNMSITFYGAFRGRVSKPSTSNPVGIEILD